MRLLEASTLARMCGNVLTPTQRATAEVGGMPLFSECHALSRPG
jgi:hypothetical protein